MEQMDRDLEQRVWDRINGADGAGNGLTRAVTDLRGMELRCRESAAAFRQLASESSGEMRQTLQRLHRQEHDNAMALLGMRILSGEEPERQQNFTVQKMGTRRALAQALRRSREAREDYAAHSADGEYGPVFRQMAQEEAKRMGEILGLLGTTR